MSYTALYREWRPKTFEDLIGQESTVRTLRNQIVSGRIPHAYLFCGTRGTGKTSMAKLLSKAVNCLDPKDGDPCNECEACRQINLGTFIDVVEIDAASNTGVDNIRKLIEDVKYPPHNAKYKIYIVDEVHMLSLSAFNALLKTLEEPPEYVIFILATTDPQKVPPTILSRCQRFDFKRISAQDAVQRLRKISDQNSVTVDDRTLGVIARVSDGAMRDALSILDQAISMSNGSIEYNEVISMLGLTSSDYIFKIAEALIDKDVESVIKAIDETILNGKDVLQYIKDLTKHFRNLLMVKISRTPEEILDLSEEHITMLKEQAKKVRSEEIMRGINIFLEAENDAKYTSQPRILLEMASIKFCRKEFDSSPETLLKRLNMLEEKIKDGSISIAPAGVDIKETVENKGSSKTQKTAAQSRKPVQKQEYENIEGVSISVDEVKKCWQEVINLIKSEKKVTVAALLSLGQVWGTEGANIIIGFDEQNAFSKNNLESNPENRRIVEESFSKILNKPIRIKLRIKENDSLSDPSIEMAKPFIDDNIFEVIEE